jgi:SHS2 domain-containing protein
LFPFFGTVRKEVDLEHAGYKEIEHTADWELEVWAENLPRLFQFAARGMYALSGVQLNAEPVETRTIELRAPDPESMLVAFLTELLYLLETENLVFDGFDIEIEEGTISAHLTGKPLAGLEKEIKAVTYHKLEVRKSGQGYTVNIVFDV